MSVADRVNVGVLVLVAALILAVVVPQGYWGYHLQLLLTGIGAATFLAAARPAIDWRLALAGAFWLCLGLLSALTGGANDLVAAASQSFLSDAIFFTGALFAASLPTLTLAGQLRQRLAIALFLVGGVLALTLPLLQHGETYNPFLWRLLGRTPQLLGGSEALELGVLCLAALWLWQKDAEKPAKIAWSLLWAAMFFAALWLSARAAALAAAVLALVVVWQERKLKPQLLGPALLTVAAGAVFWAWGGVAFFRQSLGRATLSAALQQPWGYGRGGFDRAIEAQAEPLIDAVVYDSGAIFGAPDQFFSGVLIERGVLPLLILCCFLAWYAMRLRRATQKQLGAAAVALVLLPFSDVSYNPVAWFLMAAILTESVNGAGTAAVSAQPAHASVVKGLAIATAVMCLPALHTVMSQQKMTNVVAALQVGNVIEAERQLVEYAARSRDHVEGWLALARVREAQGQFAAAADAYRKAVELASKSSRAAEQQTIVAFRAGNFKAAADSVDAWLDLPGRAPALAYRAGAFSLAKSKQNLRALKVASKGLAQYPGDIELQRLVARLKMVEGDFAAAELAWRNIVENPAATVQDAIYLEVALENLGRHEDVFALRQAHPEITLTTVTAGTLLRQVKP